MKKSKIIFYDFADMRRSVYFINGFLRNQDVYPFKFSISKKVPIELIESRWEKIWSEMLFGLCIFKFEGPSDSFYFCIDVLDPNTVFLKDGFGYHLPLLEKVKYYFKVNHNPKALENDALISDKLNKIIPVPMVFPLRPLKLAPLFPRIAPAPAAGWNLQSIRKRLSMLKRTRDFLGLEQFRILRNRRKDLDLFFVLTFYDNPEHEWMNELRLEIMERLRRYEAVISVTGFVSNGRLNGKYAACQHNRYRPLEYVMNQARAKVALYTRGCFDCLSFKLGDFLSLGLPVVGQKIMNNRDYFYKNSLFSEQFAFEKPAEIVDAAIELLNDTKRRRRISAANAEFFDMKLTPEAVTASILRRIGVA